MCFNALNLLILNLWLNNTNNAALNKITAGMLSTTWKLCNDMFFCLITVVWFTGDVSATVGVTQTQETVVSQTELADPAKSACSLKEANMVEAPQLSWQRRNEGPHFCWGRGPLWQDAVLLCSDLFLPMSC